ncbi:MAG: hypothetical protein Unbinned3138contig1000_21 [Prokaryotic dsDNA virus sp.]|nr:MAG: hypothetical protein Unbinned3138contig1000_21 [Prokaryotic dsDNA virus sp.]|tara:strand:- start:4030 stop:4608 length:579 start_codon:yes stop_codon:yes gene_type:complete
MGVMGRLLSTVFGNGRNVVAETAEVFRANAEHNAQRAHDAQAAAMQQFAAEFAAQRRTWFDSLIDGLNRLPRPLMAFGTIGLFVTAMVDPVWFAARMTGLAAMPEPMWWLLGAVVGFYFGAREIQKSRDMRAVQPDRVRDTVAAVREIEEIGKARDEIGQAQTSDADLSLSAIETTDNPALADWKSHRQPIE